MGRPLRIEYAGALYHITSRGNEKKEIFLDDADRIKFLQILEDYHDRYGILIHGYVLMGNHYHLILETPQGNLLKVMHGINGSYTGYFNRRYKRSGHLFQGRYRGILIERDAYLVPLSRYIHLNPVRAGIVEKPEEYTWSSYPGYLNEKKGHEWVECSWVLSQFGNEKDKARRGYRKYMEEVLKTRVENPMNKLYGKTVLGEKSFIEKVKKMVKGKPISRDIVERKRLRENPLPATIMKTVQRFCEVTREEITLKGKKANTARKITLYLVQRYSGLKNEEIGRLFGDIHPSAISKASTRLKEEIAHNKKLSKLVTEIESIVKA